MRTHTGVRILVHPVGWEQALLTRALRAGDAVHLQGGGMQLHLLAEEHAPGPHPPAPHRGAELRLPPLQLCCEDEG